MPCHVCQKSASHSEFFNLPIQLSLKMIFSRQRNSTAPITSSDYQHFCLLWSSPRVISFKNDMDLETLHVELLKSPQVFSTVKELTSCLNVGKLSWKIKESILKLFYDHVVRLLWPPTKLLYLYRESDIRDLEDLTSFIIVVT